MMHVIISIILGCFLYFGLSLSLAKTPIINDSSSYAVALVLVGNKLIGAIISIGSMIAFTILLK
jgi:hypothetical protein